MLVYLLAIPKIFTAFLFTAIVTMRMAMKMMTTMQTRTTMMMTMPMKMAMKAKASMRARESSPKLNLTLSM